MDRIESEGSRKLKKWVPSGQNPEGTQMFRLVTDQPPNLVDKRKKPKVPKVPAQQPTKPFDKDANDSWKDWTDK